MSFLWTSFVNNTLQYLHKKQIMPAMSKTKMRHNLIKYNAFVSHTYLLPHNLNDELFQHQVTNDYDNNHFMDCPTE